MRQVRTAALAALALLAGACAGPTKPTTAPTGGASPTMPNASPSTMPTPPPPQSQKVAYAPHPLDVAPVVQDLHVWDAERNELLRLTNDGKKSLERNPVFRTSELITYSVDGSLFQIPAGGGTPKRLFTVPGFIASVAWTANGSRAWILGIDFNGPKDTLYEFVAAQGGPSSVRTFPNPCGRGVGFDDEFGLYLSPDEASIILVETCLEPSVYVMRTYVNAGTNVVDPFWGTFARWSVDGMSLLYKEYGRSETRGRWMRLHLAAGKSSLLPLPERTFALTVSPDGKRIAYHTGGEEPVLSVYDVDAQTERKVATGYAGAVWISNEELVASRVGACDDVETCGEAYWEIKGDAGRINISTGETTTVKLRSTAWFEGYSRQADALL